MTAACTRRTALAGFLVPGLVPPLARAASPPAAAPTPMPDAPRLLVAGPGTGATGRWADIIAAALGRTLQSGAPLARENIGGNDGVTAANQFQARSPTDGGTALLVPGEAALAGLVGDSRVRFEVGSWLPLWGAECRAGLLSRVRPTPGQKLRVAITDFGGPELAALLALELMDVTAIPVAADPNRPGDLPADADAYFLRGTLLRDAIARLGPPAFTLGLLSQSGELQRDPTLPDVPTAAELVTQGGAIAHPRALLAAFRAACAASTLGECLVLPLLAPASVVAWWRQGVGGLGADPAVAGEAARRLQLTMPTGAVAAALTALNVDAPTLIELRRWLADRHHWRPA